MHRAPLEIRRAEDIAPAFEAPRPPADALYVVGDVPVNANSTRIITFALGARLPMIFYDRNLVRTFPYPHRKSLVALDLFDRGLTTIAV